METIIIYVALIIVGLCMGSFAGAKMWRIRANWVSGSGSNEKGYDRAEVKKLKKLTNKGLLTDRSQCLDCGYKLCWYDLIPLASWLILKGKCRKCRKPIGYMEPIIEISMALFFVLSYTFWPYSLNGFLEISRLVIWLIAGVALAISFAFDLRWFFLPDRSTFFVIGLGIINSAIVIFLADDRFSAFSSIMGAVLILSGVYYILNKISAGKWVGFGDVKLGLALALMLADWRLAFVAIFAANLVGCIIVFPYLIAKKMTRKSHVPFGPLLIIGFVIAGLAGNYLADLYASALL